MRSAVARLRALGAAKWAKWLEHDRDDEEPPSGAVGSSVDGGSRVETERGPRWDPPIVRASLDELVLRASHAMRRARWLAALTQSSILWTEPALIDPRRARVLVLQDGDIVGRGFATAGERAPIPPGFQRTLDERLAAFDVARLDRLRVLTTELRRVLREGDVSSAEIRLGPRRSLRGEALSRALRWV